MGFTERILLGVLLPLLQENWIGVGVGLVVIGVTYILILQKAEYKKGKHGVDRDNDEQLDDSKLLPQKFSGEDLSYILFKHVRYNKKEMLVRSKELYERMNKRRSVNLFSKDPVPLEVIENIIRTAGTSPSRAYTEPWTYVVVGDQKIKKKIREIVESEEEIRTKQRMGPQWTRDLKYLTEAPWLVLGFTQGNSILLDGHKENHEIYTAISCGILLSAIQYAGLVALTSTPLNCGPTLMEILERPPNEKLMFLLPVGFPAPNATVPNLQRKPLKDIMIKF